MKDAINLNNSPRISSAKQPLGQILHQAGLISAAQIQLALRDQSFNQQMLIGEILTLRGWIQEETVDFFVNLFPIFVEQKQEKPLGYYLKQAGLLDNNQVKYLLSLQNQRQSWIRFGKLAVINEILKQDTVDFFLKNLCSRSYLNKVYVEQQVLTK